MVCVNYERVIGMSTIKDILNADKNLKQVLKPLNDGGGEVG